MWTPAGSAVMEQQSRWAQVGTDGRTSDQTGTVSRKTGTDVERTAKEGGGKL